MKKKKLLYAGIKYSYARPSSGFSYEYNNFWDSLRQMKKLDVKDFDWVTRLRRWGKERMNKQLIQEVEKFKPDLVFFSLFRKEFDEKTIQTVSQKTLTFNWFSDDITRFESYIIDWAPLFSWVGTITDYMVPRYKKIGQRNVIYTPFACNPNLYKNLSLLKKYELTLVGQAHSNRRRIIHEIKKEGIEAMTWGKGWRGGTVSFNKMIKIINQSKINLNPTAYNTSFPLGRFLPWFLQPRGLLANTAETVLNARVFEITCCGGFLLTGPSVNIRDFFKIGEEAVMFETFDDLIEKAKYYLENDTVREKIARAGYKRAVKDHTYRKRFTDIFKKIGILN